MTPRVPKEEGFTPLDRAIDLVCHITLCKQQTQSTDTENSARSTISTLSSTCTRLPVARTQIGIQITRPAMPPSGISKTIRIVRYGYGSRLRQDTKTINWWLATSLSTSNAIRSTSHYQRLTIASNELYGRSTRIIFCGWI